MTSDIIVVTEPKQNLTIIDSQEPFVGIVNIGTPGPEGKEGKPGDLHFKFIQGSASSEWIIEHELKKFPSVTVQDSANENVEGFCEYINENKLILTFSAAFSGVAYLN